MLEQGRCARGSSNCFCRGTDTAVGLVAIDLSILAPPLRVLGGRAGISNCFDTPHLPDVPLDQMPANSYFLAEVLCQGFSRETLGFQFSYFLQVVLVDQHVCPRSFVHTTRRRLDGAGLLNFLNI